MKLKQAKVYSKKSLSIFLAVIMLVMTCSVAFGVSALPSTTDTDAINTLYNLINNNIDLVQAVKNQDDSVLSYTKDTTVTVGTSETTLTNYVTVNSYSDYVRFVALVDAVWAAADYCVQYNEEGTYKSNGNYNVTFPETSTVYGENINSISQEIVDRLTAKKSTYGTYYSYFLELVFGWYAYGDSLSTDISNVLSAKSYDDTSWGKALGSYDVSEYGTLKFNLVVQTTDAIGWFDYNDASGYADMTLKSTYTANMSRYSNGSSSSMRRFWGFGSNSADKIINSANLVEEANSSATITIFKIDVFKARISAIADVYDTFDKINTLYSSSQTDFDEALADIISAYDFIATAIGDGDSDTSDEAAIIASLFEDSAAYQECYDNFMIVDQLADYMDTAEALSEMITDSSNYGIFNSLGFGDGVDLAADYKTFTANYDALQSLTDEAYAYLIGVYQLSSTQIETYYTNFGDNVDAYSAQSNKADLDALVDTYGDYTAEEIAELNPSSQSAIYSQLNTLLTKVEGYSDQVINAENIFAGDLEDYYKLKALFYCEVDATVAYFMEMGLATDLTTYGTDYLIDCLEDYAVDYRQLEIVREAIIAETEDEDFAYSVLEKVFEYADELEDRIKEALAEIFTTQVEAAYTTYYAIKTEVDASGMNAYYYFKLKSTIGAIDDEIVDVLGSEYTTLVSSLTQTHYDALSDIIEMYEAFAATYGLATYVDYDSETSNILEYDDREVYDDDIFKTEAYEVEESDMTAIIELLDSLLADPEIVTLLAELLGLSEGDTTYTLGTIVQDLVVDYLFSDSIINMIVGFIYPLVEGEFNGITLPTSVELGSLGSLSVTYEKTLADAVCDATAYSGSEGGLAIDPQSLAWVLDDELADTYDGDSDSFSDIDYASFMTEGILQLSAAGTNWYSEEIYDPDTQSWVINWGMDDFKKENADNDEITFEDYAEQFINSAGAALQGLFPLLKALLLGQSWYNYRESLASATFMNIMVDVELKASGNDGYVNLLGPIFEVLGYDGYATTSACAKVTNATEFVELAYNDVYATIKNLLLSPVENILSAIPGLVYALMFDMIPELLKMLETTIEYHAYAVGIDAFNDTMGINVGDMLDLGDMGIDTSNGLNGILALLGVELEGFNEGLLASLGTCDIVSSNRTASIYGLDSGKAYKIDGNAEAVLYYVLTYVIDSVKDGSLYTLLGAFLDADTIATVEEYVGYTNIGSSHVDAGDIVAAVVELFEPESTYGDAAYISLEAVNITFPLGYDENGSIVEGPFGYYWDEETKLFYPETYDDLYNEYWTQDKADFVVDDLVNYAVEICQLLGYDVELTSLLTTTVDDLLTSLYTMDTIEMILDLIQPLIQEYTQDDETISMIVELVDTMGLIDNIDISDYIDTILGYECPQFEDGDREAFLEVIVSFIEPLVPILDFLLISCEDDSAALTLLDGTASLTNYDGYTSAILPLLEALGCDSDSMKTYAEFAASTDEEKVYAIIDPIFDLIDNYVYNTEDDFAIYGVLSLIPNILYFIEYGGLNAVLQNILRPVFVLLDTIRPIYSVPFGTIDIDVLTLVEGLINDLLADIDIDEYILINEIDISAIISGLMEFGYTEERTSVNGDTYNYFVFCEESYSEVLTVVLLNAVELIVFGDEIQQYIDLLGSLGGLIGTDSEIGVFLTDLSTMSSGQQVLLVLYYVVYGLEYGTDIYDSLSETVKEFLIGFLGTDSTYFDSIFDKTNELLENLGVFFGGDGYDASEDETLSWFQQLLADIKAFFESLFSWLTF